jgi:hypothetical protein
MKRKGYVGVFLGFGTILLILVAIYVIISIFAPPIGDQVVHEVGELAGAVSKAVPKP